MSVNLMGQVKNFFQPNIMNGDLIDLVKKSVKILITEKQENNDKRRISKKADELGIICTDAFEHGFDEELAECIIRTTEENSTSEKNGRIQTSY